jgi:23S rRNA pseudouridine1911/1915/1917 synthase
MRQLFTDRQMDKTYLAFVTKLPDPYEADLTNWMYKDRNKNLVEIVKGERVGAVKARTTYKTLGKIDRFYLIRLHPITGKSHQLRVHMAFIGSPIFGDVKYGGQSMNDPNAFMLHCRQMEFIHPIQKVPVVLKADFPNLPLWRKHREEILGLEEQE